MSLIQPTFLKQRGFTLIELMVSLVIGLIVSAAALQLFIGGIITSRMQEASAELQDSGVFGLEYMARDIRLANYGNINNPILNNTTPMGGIVLTSGETNANLGLKDVDAGLLTSSNGEASATGNSDQLTIQFFAPNDMLNCEGKKVKANEYVIQRYFLRADGSNLSLACDANTPGSTSVSITGLNDSNNGEVIMPRVDQLRFYLGAKVGDKFAYYTIQQYKDSVKTAVVPNIPRIISIRVMVLVRSKDSTSSNNIDPSKESFKFLDTEIKATDTKTKYMRRLYATTIALRNGLGEKVYESGN
ncbi:MULTISPECIES: PilW family protein [unclassified Acinetobacter]|uniref:PilW family protein n=1 Tax=unclassified Acinetobacter TaxID=196816 RepID=UPI0015D0E480|nr:MULTISPECIES: PilW family protein [unclassified Acinetobacter]